MPSVLVTPPTPTAGRRSRRAPLLPRFLSSGTRRGASAQALPYLLGSLLICVSTLIGQVVSWTLLIFTVCAVWRYLLERRGRPVPPQWVRLVIFAPSLWGIVMVYGIHPTPPSLLATLIVLLSLKVLELRNARDFTVVALLGYFMILSGLFYNQDLGVCLYLVLAVLLNTLALIRVHLGSEPRTFWPSVRLATGLLLQAAPLVALLFVVFPRVQGSFLKGLSHSGKGTMGMSNVLQPGAVESLAQSTELAFRAKILGKSPQLPGTELYWRGVVLAKCVNPMLWRAEEGQWLKGTPSPPPPRSPAAGLGQEITLVTQGENWMYALDRPVAVLGSAIKPQFFRSLETLNSEQPVYSPVTYTVFSALPNPVGIASPTGQAPELGAEARKFYLKAPPDVSPRVRELALGWRANGATPEQVVRAAEEYFRTGGFVYTLHPGRLPTRNALDVFLFQTKQGFCEHFAAAFASLMRVAGLPSRIVVGYQGGEFNYMGGWYKVRQSDAHAWCEVWLEGRGWRREDSTALVAPDRVSYGADLFAQQGGDSSLSPESRPDRMSALAWVRRLSRDASMAWDSVDQQWNLLVIGYDTDMRFTFLTNLGLGNVSWLTGVALAVTVMFAALLMGVAVMRAFQGWPGWRGRRRDPGDAARAWYGRFCKRLKRVAGVERLATEGPLDYAVRATATRPDLGSEIGRITELYVNLRYTPAAEGTVDREGLAGLENAVRRFRPVKKDVGGGL